jgi:uncharacterized protein
LKDPSLPIFEGWLFTPEGAAVHCDERTAVIADVHLGYEWARGASGDVMMAHSLHETLARLLTLLGRTTFSQLVVAGDLLESSRPCTNTARDLQSLRSWLADRGIAFVVLKGNHDTNFSLSRGRASGASNRLPETCMIAGWTIGHGHRPIPGAQSISGHHHPVFRCQGVAAPCFLVGSDRIVLPAFSPNAAGCDVVSSTLPKEWLAGSLRCLVSTGDDILDFGPLAAVRGRLRRHAH